VIGFRKIAWLHGRRLGRAGLVAAIVVAAAAIAGFAPAAASASCGSDCHGVTRWDPATQNTGEIATIDTSSLSVSNACTQTAYSTSWEDTDSSGFAYWIEQGIHVGVHYNGTCGNGDQFYWADKRPNGGGYNEHYPGGSVGFNVNYAFKILYDGSSQWEVDRNGSVIGYSTSNPCCSIAMAAGAESHQDTVIVSGEAHGLQKYINGSWSYAWTKATVYNPEGFFTMSGDPTSDEYYAH
jgi:hypothetical protein